MIQSRVLEQKIKEIDDFSFNAGVVKEFTDDEIEKLKNNYKKLVEKNIPQERKSILGIDIYQYSQFPEGQQELIPFIYNAIIEGAIHYLGSSSKAIYNERKKKAQFIPTGDGGYYIFPTPLHALIFNCCIHEALHMFNSRHFLPKLSKYVGGLTIRSAITYDNLFRYENNWYGRAIIKNARILSKDKLNRFLIDKETHNFFMNNFNGLESLMVKIDDEIMKVMQTVMESNFESFEFDNSKFRNIHVQRLEDTVAKETKLSIYNVEIQYSSIVSSNDGHETSFILTIGNSNVMNV
jgi:hypothetical protein